MYLDAAYIVRLYLPDPGFELVRNLVAHSPSKPASLIHGRAEVCAAMHRGFREGRMDAVQFATVFDQFEADCRWEKFDWLPLTDPVMAKIAASFRSLPAAQFLRAGDALHLASAAERGYAEIYSNDARLLAAAPHFGIRGVNIIP
jgi:predicted nucleic acid-binding protein